MKAKLFLFSFLFVAGTISLAQIPEFWFLDEVNPGQDISLYADGSNIQNGDFSCKMTLEQPEVPYLISDNFAVNEGDAYTFSIYYFDNDDRGTLKFYADFYDAQGNDIYGEDPVESVDGGSWQEVTWSGTVPAGAVHGYILIKFYDESTFVDEAIAWVDHAQFMANEQNLVLNGSFESWPGVGIAESKTALKISVYPNPVSGISQFSNFGEADRLEIRNTMGQVVRSIDLEGNRSVIADLTNLDNGLYLISGYGDGRLIGSAKILKH